MERRDIDRIFKDESARAIASLVRRFGDIDVAEEAVQQAFAVAIEVANHRQTPLPCRLDHHHGP